MLALLGDPDRQRATFAEACAWADQIVACLGWLEGGDAQGPSWDILEPHLSKLQTAIIGFGFMRSEPALLARLYEQGTLRVVSSTDGGYAPNAFVFRKGERLRALIGSAPFSSTLHEESVEAMVIYEGDAQEAFSLQVLALVDRCRNAGHVPTREELDEYKEARMRELTRLRGVVEAPLSMRAKRFHAPGLDGLRLVTDRALIKQGIAALVAAMEHGCSWEGESGIKVKREWRLVWLHWLRALDLWAVFERDDEHARALFGVSPDNPERLEVDFELAIAHEGITTKATAAFAQCGADPALYLVFRGVRQGRTVGLSPEAVDRLGGGISVEHDGEALRAITIGNVLAPDIASTLAAFGRELKACMAVLP